METISFDSTYTFDVELVFKSAITLFILLVCVPQYLFWIVVLDEDGFKTRKQALIRLVPGWIVFKFFLFIYLKLKELK